MDWTVVMSRNRALLCRIAAALAAVVAGRDVLARRAYLAVLSVLRPAEAAVRRLIVVAARGLVLKLQPAKTFPSEFAAAPGMAEAARRPPAFALIDPLKRFPDGIWAAAVEDEAEDDGFASAPPRISVPGFLDPKFATPKPLPLPDEPVSAAALLSRLAALQHALANLPRQARRLARWRARQQAALKTRSGPWTPLRLSPLRPGPPPGHRDRRLHPVDAVLEDCHHFALEALARWSG